jgi:hypothetical protein
MTGALTQSLAWAPFAATVLQSLAKCWSLSPTLLNQHLEFPAFVGQLKFFFYRKGARDESRGELSYLSLTICQQ